MNIPVYLEFPNLEYIHNLTMQAIATHCSFLLFVLWNSAVSRAQSDEDEVAKEVQNLLDQANHGPAPTQAATTQAYNHLAPTQAAKLQVTGCAAAGYTRCCTGDNCKVESGCYCDVKCYYFHNCCDDITSIGCYRKYSIHLVCCLSYLIHIFRYNLTE